MPNDLDYGYQVPAAGDESRRQWMPVITAFIRRIVGHSHDGNDSVTLSSIDISKQTVELLAGRVQVTDAAYTIGAATASIGITSITGGTYGYGDDIANEAYVVSGDTAIVTMSSNFTASSTGGTLTFSGFKKTDDSLWQRTVTMSTGNVATNNLYKVYISSSGANQFETIYPTVVDTESNTMVIEINDDQYDLKVKVV